MSQVLPSLANQTQIVDFRDSDDRWNDYVAQHAKGSVFHTREMQDVFAATPKYEPFAIAMLNDEGRVVALLASVRIVTISGLISSFASRAIWYAEPLCDDSDEGRAALAELLRKHDRHMKSRTLFTEVRALLEPGVERGVLESEQYEFLDYLNYVVDTTSNEETLYRQLNKSCRKKITRDQKRGVRIEIENTHEAIDVCYRFISESYKRSKVPLADCRLFHEALDRLPAGTVQVRIAYIDDEPAASGIGLVYGDRFFAWYGGTARFSSATPFSCLTWDEIRWSSEHGLSFYDFGGAGWPDEEYGPRDFKAKFGGELVRYGRYRKVYAKLALGLAKTSYEVVRKVLPI